MKNNFFNLNNTAKAGHGTSSVNIEKLSKNDIAIIGMSGRLPLAEDLDAFWNNLATGTDCVIEFPQQRADEVRNYLKFKEGDNYNETDFKFKRKGFLSAIDKFDYKFFKLTAKEAAIMNPAQRIFLQTAYHTIENAGYSVKKLKGSQTGIFLGYTGGSEDYLNLVKETEPEFAVMAYPANLASVIASRVAYVFDFKGPSLLIDTACSSSMVAFNMACQSLREGACDTALAGGINLSWAPLQEEGTGLGILSSSGKTKTFDETSDGTVGGEGCIAILLKPLNKAIRDNDNILAIVKGIACNQDGTSIGITAPNALAQADVIEKAWSDGKIDPETISYIEAHGTGTSLGDPIEIEGITQAFRRHTDKRQFCAIGAVKTNVGHLNSVAGVAGIAKAVLCLKNKQLPALLHFERPNEKIVFEESPVYVNTRLSNWDTEAGAPRRCGVSSFGMSGTNCHVVLQESTSSTTKKEFNAKYLFALSAKSKSALTQLISRYQQFLDDACHNIENICFTATAGRDHHEHRVVFEVSDTLDLKEKIGLLASAGIDNKDEGITYNDITKNEDSVGDLHSFIAEINRQADVLITDNNLYTYDYLLSETAKLYALGADIDWEKLYAGRTPGRIELPAYPFEQKRCWVTYPEQRQTSSNEKDHQDSNVNKPTQAMDKANNNIGNDQTTAIGDGKTGTSQLSEIINMQLRVMEGQLEAVKNFLALQTIVENYEITPDGICVKDEVTLPVVKNQLPVIEKTQQKATPVSYSPNTAQADKAITTAQQQYVDELIRLFNIKTKTSKDFTQAKRQYYANNRHVAGYSKTYKEMMYPILVDQAHGSQIIDLDGNKYVDFCMGFGVYLLGYTNPLVMKGLEEQAAKGSYLGPMSALPGEVAQLVCELTGVERVAFYNSGTEAVMLALRLARAATSKTKIVMFSGSYHGTYDGVMGQADRFSKEFKAVPKSTGIPQSILDEVILLDYGTPESLDIIRKHAHELAGVLVEPVQSRRPEFQPKEYLLALRELTEELKVPLIFDEIITGFRIHPGGAQAWFGIKADLVTYGKIPGGGMPIGIIAGKAEFMHGVDGGVWQYGDDSHPKFDHRKTFVAGTFCHHPLTMASAKAALTYLKEQGPGLQETLNKKTADMAKILNAYFEQENFEIKIVNFGSLFQIRTDYDLSLIVYHFLNSGIYAWEGMTFFISTAHSDQDIEFLISVFKNTLQKLRAEGFIPAKVIQIAEDNTSVVLSDNNIAAIALTEEQRRLWFIATADDNASVAFNSTRLFNVDEKVSETAFSAAVQKLANRHELLKAVSIDGDFIHIDQELTYDVAYISIDGEDPAEIDALVRKEKQTAFNFSNGPFFRIRVINYGGDKSLFVLVVHHIIADGWSVNVIFEELTALYQAELQGTGLNLPAAIPFSAYINWLEDNYTAAGSDTARQYWASRLARKTTPLSFPALAFKNTNATFYGNSCVLKLNSNTTDRLAELAKSEGCTVFMLLLSLYNVFLNKVFGNDDFVVGIPSAGQLNMEAESLVGCCVQLLPFFAEVNDEQTFSEFLSTIKNDWLTLYKNRNFPYVNLTRDNNYNLPPLSIAFNMDAPVNISPEGDDNTDEKGDIYKKEADYNKYNLFLNVAKVNKNFKLTFQYNSALFDTDLMESWIDGFAQLVEDVIIDPGKKVQDLELKAASNEAAAPIVVYELKKGCHTKNACGFFCKKTLKNPADLAVSGKGKLLTYDDVKTKAHKLASALKNEGFRKGNVIGVLLADHEEILSATLGIIQAGCAYVLLTPSQVSSLAKADGTCLVDAIVTKHDLLPAATEADVKIIDIDEPDTSKSDLADHKFEMIGANDLVKVVINTSANEEWHIMHNYGSQLAYYGKMLTDFNLDSADELFILTGNLDAGLISDLALMAFLNRKRIVFGDSKTGNFNHAAGSALILDKSVWVELVKNAAPQLHAIPQIVIGQTLLLGEQVNLAYKNNDGQLYFGYFSAQVSKVISALKVTEELNDIIVLPIGGLLEPDKYRLVNSQFKPQPQGIFGTLYAEADFVDGAKAVENGGKYFVPVNRSCRVLNNKQLEANFLAEDTEAKRLYAAILTETVNVLDRVKNVTIRANHQQELVAYVSFVNASSSNIYEVEKQLKKHFLTEFLPAEYIEVNDKFFGNENEDDSFELLQTNKNDADSQISPLEADVLAIFRSVLNHKGLGVNDNFFDYGGNSLRAIQIISQIHKTLNVKLQLKKIFTQPTVAGLAAIIKNSDQDNYTTIEPIAKQAFYDISHAQKRLWILDQVQKNQTAYLISKAYILEGNFNVGTFNDALETLIQRHESLRTNFEQWEGEPKQRISDFAAGTYKVNYADIRNENDKDALLETFAAEETQTPIDLAKDALLRVKVVHIEEDKYALFLTIHHIIADGWSMEIIVKEIVALYNAYKDQLPNPLTPFKIQYKDFAAWQNNLLQGAGIEVHKNYWLNLFSDGVPVIDLPTDYARPLVKSSNGGKVQFNFDKELSDKIYAISKIHGASTFTTLLTITKALLYKYTGQNDLIIGSTTAGRDHIELDNQIGIYANTLIFKTQFNENDSFEQLLANVKEVSLNAYEHQLYPFDEIVDNLNLQRDLSRSPIFDVMIELDDIDIELGQEEVAEDIKFSMYDKDILTSKYDLSFRFNAGETIFGSIEFNSDLFEKGTIEKMTQHLAQIVFAADAAIKQPLAQLNFLSNEEESQLLVDFNQDLPLVLSESNIQQAFEQAVEKYGDSIAVEFGQTTLTYNQLNEKVNGLAGYLVANYNIGPGDKIGVMANRSERMIIALLGILKAGAAFVPINPEFPKERVNYIVTDANIKLMLTDSDFMFDLSDITDISLFVMDIELDSVADVKENVTETGTETDLAYIIYTSGSTGTPKGVEIERHSFVNYINWANAYYFNNTPGKTFPFFTSLTFDLTLTSIFSTLTRGDKLVVFEHKDVNEILKTVFDAGNAINAVKMTPAHISLLGYLNLSATNVAQVIVGGEALTIEQVNILKGLNKDIKIYNEYGPTEATVGCIVKEISSKNELILIGKPINNLQIHILDKHLNLVPVGVKGEIYIGGAGVARGYANNPELTSQKFINHPLAANQTLYKTGDVARWRKNGEVEFLGRNDDQVKINGYRIELAEIESILLNYEGVKHAVVVVKHDNENLPLLAAYYVSDSKISAAELVPFLKESLPQYMVPSFFVQLDAMPITLNGKINKKALPNPLNENRSQQADYKAPVNAIEQRIATIWERIFSMDKIGVQDNFFELGGHSLKATQIILEVFKEFGVNVELDEIFTNPTIEELAKKVASSDKSEYVNILPVAKQELYPVSNAQNRLWILNLLEDNQTAYVIPDAFMLEGEFNLTAFCEAFNSLVKRHESLRTTFVALDGDLKQQIHEFEDFAFAIEYTDLRGLENWWPRVKEEIQIERNSSFDLGKGPLIRGKVFQVEDQKSAFLLTMHHIISDGWSFEVLLREVSESYCAYAQGLENNLPPLAIQYKDYASWQLDYLKGKKLEEHRNFWMNYLGGDIKPIEIPTDYQRGVVRTYNGDTVRFLLGKPLTQKIKKLSQDNACSVFMTLVTIIDVLLYRYTWEKDITIGFPIAGRSHKDLENQIGFYLNTLAIRVNVDTEETIESLLGRVKEAALDIFKYQLYSFDLIVEDLNIERKPNRSPLFDIGLTWQNQMEMNLSGDVEFKDLKIRQLEEDCVIAKHDVWFYGSEIDSSFDIRIRYNTDLYSKETMEKIREDFLKICETIVDDPKITLNNLVSLFTNNNLVLETMSAINSNISEDF